MNKYNTFLSLFIASAIAGICFMLFYLRGFLLFATHVFSNGNSDMNFNPMSEMFNNIFSPTVIILFVIAIITGLASRIYGIVIIAKNKTIKEGEKALWIIGFVVMNFITSIIFLIMAKDKKLTE